jgi:signal transduction histidine kinase
MIKILLVDDREDNLLSLGVLLEGNGYKLIKAKSGREALKILLLEYDFALILMDVEMPNLSGFETASLIYEREKLRHIPIIFITAHSDDNSGLFKGYHMGAVDFLYKPLNAQILRAKVSVFVELHKKTIQLMIQEQKLIATNKNLENEIQEHRHSEKKIMTLNLQLLQNIEKLEIANKSLDRFAFLASHDLQEPLRKIRTFSEILISECGKELSESGNKYLLKIQEATKRSQALIKDIMNISTMFKTKAPFIQSDLNAILTEAIGELDEAIVNTHATILCEKLPGMKVNPNLIKSLFYNLLQNAIKYRKEGTDPVIKVYCQDDGNVNEGKNMTTPVECKYYRIAIEDNGLGFDQQYSEKIFDIFTRLHPQNEFTGTGIGLALCKKIAEEHGGYIWAKSNPGSGAVFILSLPRN